MPLLPEEVARYTDALLAGQLHTLPPQLLEKVAASPQAMAQVLDSAEDLLEAAPQPALATAPNGAGPKLAKPAPAAGGGTPPRSRTLWYAAAAVATLLVLAGGSRLLPTADHAAAPALAEATAPQAAPAPKAQAAETQTEAKAKATNIATDAMAEASPRPAAPATTSAAPAARKAAGPQPEYASADLARNGAPAPQASAKMAMAADDAAPAPAGAANTSSAQQERTYIRRFQKLDGLERKLQANRAPDGTPGSLLPGQYHVTDATPAYMSMQNGRATFGWELRTASHDLFAGVVRMELWNAASDNPVAVRTVAQTGGRMNYTLEQQLLPGLYYWKLYAGTDLVYVNKFKLYQ